MKILPTIAFSLMLTFMSCLKASAQPEKKPLSNNDVVQMVKAGLAEAVILSAIQSSPAGYDTSPAALIELNKQGVTAKIQEAMLGAGKGPAPGVTQAAATAQAQAQAQAAAGMHGSGFGVWMMNGTERVELKQNKGEMDHIAAPFYAKSYTKFEGPKAALRVATPTPVFEISVPGNLVASEHIALVKPEVKKNQREIPNFGIAGPGVRIRPDKKARLELTIEEAKRDGTGSGLGKLYRVQPSKSLPAGEYVLKVISSYYCFGVDDAK